jgi:hypothetical protein
MITRRAARVLPDFMIWVQGPHILRAMYQIMELAR